MRQIHVLVLGTGKNLSKESFITAALIQIGQQQVLVGFGKFLVSCARCLQINQGMIGCRVGAVQIRLHRGLVELAENAANNRRYHKSSWLLSALLSVARRETVLTD